MSNPIPNSLSLTTISGQITSAPHVNNYSALQTAVNEIITILNSGTSGQVLESLGPTATGWTSPGTTTTYRKTTAKTVNNSAAETDLLNGEITVAANVMGTSGLARVTAWGDYLQNATSNWRFKLKLGATTIIDTGANIANANSATRGAWMLNAEILNTATNAQVVRFKLAMGGGGQFTNTATALTTGEGNVAAPNDAGTGTDPRATVIGVGTAAEDTTSSKVIAFTVTQSVASVNVETKLTGALVEII